jgi:hypothetical protein
VQTEPAPRASEKRYHQLSRMPDSATYVYCVVQRATRPRLARQPRGVPAASAVDVIALGPGLWCAVAEVPLDRYGEEPLQAGLKDLGWIGNVASGHEGVVQYFTRMRGTSVVPMTLFTMFLSRERAVAELRGRRSELMTAFRRIRGCDEWSLRIVRTPAPASRPRARGAAVSERTGAAFLAAKKHARDDAREDARRASAGAEAAYEALARLAREARRRAEIPEAAVVRPLLEAAFLVPSGRKSRFRALARKAANSCRAVGADLKLTGPWPAYDFVQPMDASR